MTAGSLNGILNVLKPPGMTSFDVVANLRRILKIKKIGHTGTLDPGAVGVLPVCVGKATKAIEFMTEKDKVYRAELKLGISTDTQDMTGEVIETKDINVTKEQIQDAVMSFVGDYSQIPPMYSAVKINGQKLYDLARRGITVERKPRNVKIYNIDIIDISEDGSVLFDVACSKGTYIRTLCADIGEKLGCGGCMSFLIRLKSGPFDIASSLTFDEIIDLSSKGHLHKKMFPVDKVFEDLDEIILKNSDVNRIVNGAGIRVYKRSVRPGMQLRVYDENQKFVALGVTSAVGDTVVLKSKKLFLT